MASSNRASFSLEDEYVELLKEIAWRERRSMTEQLRLMIDARAVTMGLSPVQSHRPKIFSLDSGNGSRRRLNKKQNGVGSGQEKSPTLSDRTFS